MSFKDMRIKHGLSVQDVASLLKLTPATIYRYEKDGRLPTKSILKNMVQLYKCDATELGTAILENLEV